MAYPKQWRGNPTKKVLQIPTHLAEATMALARLLDKGDEELMDFLESRSIAIPQKP